jgi:hypothetical protein
LTGSSWGNQLASGQFWGKQASFRLALLGEILLKFEWHKLAAIQS